MLQHDIPVVKITSSAFLESYRQGISWANHGDLTELSEGIIVQYVKDNVIGEAFDMTVTDADIARHMAFFMGWVVTMCEKHA
jgi:hypothetical protein